MSLAAFEATLQTDPKSVAANNGAGVALDLMGRYREAQPYFTAAIKAGRTPLEKALAERASRPARGFESVLALSLLWEVDISVLIKPHSDTAPPARSVAFPDT